MPSYSDANDNDDASADNNAAAAEATLPQISRSVDDDTLRIMLSTDNHLGYAERDPVRGMDSFAAFEEVLCLAKRFRCDMVLIAGDLFHENRPTRHTLHKTMDILRRYCLGQSPVKIQILSEPAKTFRSKTVNYLDENVSVDLPVFSIHGNHDDPTRDVSGENLAALDLLSVTSLVNYFGRQELNDQVEVPPVLMQKGRTKVAVYGLGSMRDERLNRMWNQGKVRFLKTDDPAFFNIFALHQNRDVGRGSKNCIREDMIPEWMDVVMWGHEHECQIEIQESVTGTFRITQPGSSVATSLVAGEAVLKKVGVLDVVHNPDGTNQFRLNPIPLTQVRGFVTTELCLRDHRARLDPEDPKVDAKITAVLEDEVRLMIRNARDKVRNVGEMARQVGSGVAEEDEDDDVDVDAESSKIQYRLHKPDEVLVRIKVDHSGFSSLNNQRFGSRFVGEVANPGDILLFSRRKDPSSSKPGGGGGSAAAKAGSRSARMLSSLRNAIPPDEAAPATVEDLVMGQLEAPERKMQLLDKVALSEAVVEFTEKHTASAIPDAAVKMIKRKQKELIKRSRDGDDCVIEKGSQVRDILDAESLLKDEGSRAKDKGGKRSRDDDDDYDKGNGGGRKAKKSGKENAPDEDGMDDDYDEDEVQEVVAATRKSNAGGRSKEPSRNAASAADHPQRKAARREQYLNGSDEDDDDEVMEEVAPKAAAKARSRKAPAPAASTNRAKRSRPAKRPNYADDDDDEVADDGDDSDQYVARRGDSEEDDNVDDLGFGEDEEEEEDDDQPRNKRGKKAPASRGGRSAVAAGTSNKKAPGASSRARTTSGTTQPRKALGASSRFDDSEDDDDRGGRRVGKAKRGLDDDMDDDWGTAATRSQY